MKVLELIIKNLPPQPRNATHESNHRLSDIAKMFQDDIRERFKRTGKRDFFEDCDSLILNLVVYTPVSQFLTKEKKLSKTSIDFDAHKLLVDEIAKFFGFNDGLIFDASIIKLPISGDEWVFKLTLTGFKDKQWPLETTATLIVNFPKYQVLD